MSSRYGIHYVKRLLAIIMLNDTFNKTRRRFTKICYQAVDRRTFMYARVCSTTEIVTVTSLLPRESDGGVTPPILVGSHYLTRLPHSDRGSLLLPSSVLLW